jgi:hypothetical protein
VRGLQGHNMKTSDIFFAAFLRLKGYAVKDFEVISRGRGRFIFDISENDWKQRKLEFLQSDINKIKLHQEELKDLLY